MIMFSFHILDRNINQLLEEWIKRLGGWPIQRISSNVINMKVPKVIAFGRKGGSRFYFRSRQESERHFCEVGSKLYKSRRPQSTFPPPLELAVVQKNGVVIGDEEIPPLGSPCRRQLQTAGHSCHVSSRNCYGVCPGRHNRLRSCDLRRCVIVLVVFHPAELGQDRYVIVLVVDIVVYPVSSTQRYLSAIRVRDFKRTTHWYPGCVVLWVDRATGFHNSHRRRDTAGVDFDRLWLLPYQASSGAAFVSSSSSLLSLVRCSVHGSICRGGKVCLSMRGIDTAGLPYQFVPDVPPVWRDERWATKLLVLPQLEKASKNTRCDWCLAVWFPIPICCCRDWSHVPFVLQTT